MGQMANIQIFLFNYKLFLDSSPQPQTVCLVSPEFCSVCWLVGLQQSVYLAEFLLNLPAFIFKSNNKTLQNDYYHHHLPTSDLQQLVEKQNYCQISKCLMLRSHKAIMFVFYTLEIAWQTDRRTLILESLCDWKLKKCLILINHEVLTDKWILWRVPSLLMLKIWCYQHSQYCVADTRL